MPRQEAVAVAILHRRDLQGICPERRRALAADCIPQREFRGISSHESSVRGIAFASIELLALMAAMERHSSNPEMTF